MFKCEYWEFDTCPLEEIGHNCAECQSQKFHEILKIVYRDFLTIHKGDFWDLAKDEESRDYYKSLAAEISTVLKSNDPRIKPMF